MKKSTIIFLSTFCFALGIISCTKNSASNTTNNIVNDSLYVSVDSCKNLIYNNVNYNICFDSLLTESRCPTGAVCVWAGIAQGRFKVTFNNQIYTIKLATYTTANYKNDTTIAGVTFSLDSLTPHPAINNIYPYSAYKAKIKISQ